MPLLRAVRGAVRLAGNLAAGLGLGYGLGLILAEFRGVRSRADAQARAQTLLARSRDIAAVLEARVQLAAQAGRQAAAEARAALEAEAAGRRRSPIDPAGPETGRATPSLSD